MRQAPVAGRRLLGLLLLTLLLLWPSLAWSPGPPAPPEAPGLRAAFAQAAFRSEYDQPGTNSLRRWQAPLRVLVEGEATGEDVSTLTAFMDELNTRVPGFPGISMAASAGEANVTLTFAPLADLPGLLAGYVPGNWGFFMFWTQEEVIISARVLIASDITSQQERNHLILEEVTGLLGLPNDLDEHPDSIIHQRWTTTQSLSQLDWQLLSLLYDSRLSPGMGWLQAQAALGWE